MIQRIKPIYLLILLIFIAIPVLVLWLYLIAPRPRKEIGIPTPILTPLPQRATPLPTIPNREESIRVLRHFPVQGADLYYLPIQPVEFLFTGTVNPNELDYKVEPFVKTEVKRGSTPNSLIISPVVAWKEGIIKITITSETRSNDGKILYPPFEYILNTAEPPGP